ncbi:hypothetical protein ACWCP8_40935 [Streptomyces sp. NPDC002206]
MPSWTAVDSQPRPTGLVDAQQRLELAPGEAGLLTFCFHGDLSAFTDRSGYWVVEPGR